jgi:hypothetical protein
MPAAAPTSVNSPLPILAIVLLRDIDASGGRDTEAHLSDNSGNGRYHLRPEPRGTTLPVPEC